MTRSKIIAWTAGGLLLAVLAVPAKRTNPPVTADFDGPAEVKAILQRSCYDCHSNETKWPWYSRVGPVSWVLASHVNEGREHLNFSEWGSLEDDVKVHAADEIWEEVEDEAMPLPMYTRVHPEAKLSEQDKTVLRAWADSLN